MQKLLFPSDIQAKILRTYQKNRCTWLTGEAQWPLVFSLGSPKEVDVNIHSNHVRSWVASWREWQGPGELGWINKQWRVVGDQQLPSQLVLLHANAATAWLGESTRYALALTRYQSFITKWPVLSATLSRHYEILANYSDLDFHRLESFLEWILSNPQSNLYPRQLPVVGLDSKWLEVRKVLIAELVANLKMDLESDFYSLLGLKRIPNLIRFRILDQHLRNHMRGLDDITTTVSALAALDLAITKVFIVENIQTGLAFNDIEGAIVIFGLGYNVECLFSLPWLAKMQCFYWGDIDTHGFAILNRARSYLPKLQSILMDDATLHHHQMLWGREEKQHAALSFPLLSVPEHETYLSIKKQHWGENVRLEQEKIDWSWAWNFICSLPGNYYDCRNHDANLVEIESFRDLGNSLP